MGHTAVSGKGAMRAKLRTLLDGGGGNYILPFLWMHGEDEAVLRDYMRAIDACGVKAVCVESRPHPDFCGEGWWRDMDVILDEARRRGMKVWILDDSHFPTGWANGAMERADAALARRSVAIRSIPFDGSGMVTLSEDDLAHAADWTPSPAERFLLRPEQTAPREGDVLLAAAAVSADGRAVDLTPRVRRGERAFHAPGAGAWRLCVCHSTRNRGPHRDYINMMDADSCRVLIDAVYEPHYARYRDDFGSVIAGFFSDEPELGNGHLYEQGKRLWELDDLPWSRELERRLREKWGGGFAANLALLWQKDAVQPRVDFMDEATRLVETCFSEQLGDWCRARGVEYIGHVIEDNDQHARTGTSLGHYFRGLAGQDMAGIDDIGGQVYPGGEYTCAGSFGNVRIGEFFHYTLGKLGSSAASIEPRKKGRAMCEVFGNYGWKEGVRLEKYLVDHFLVRGINRFVPHAFNPAPFPDPDCPPHFYAHGHDPLYRHFGCLMRYTNRVCELMDGGHPVVSAAILYMAEAEWAGEFMPMHVPAQALCDAQIDYEFLPADVFAQPERYGTRITDALCVNGQTYHALIVPETDYLCEAAAEGVARLLEHGVPVVFVGGLPRKVAGTRVLPSALPSCHVVPTEKLAEALRGMGLDDVRLTPENSRIRVRRYENGGECRMLVNEGGETYRGVVSLRGAGALYAYNAWDNRVESVKFTQRGGRTDVCVELEPLKSLLLVSGEPPCAPALPAAARAAAMRRTELGGWRRSLCESARYPAFGEARAVTLPDALADEAPEFSGFVRYETDVRLDRVPDGALLEITDAHEGVEAFVNGVSAGIQIAPPFLFDVSALLREGENTVRVEVATTLERKMAQVKSANPYFKAAAPEGPSGVSGKICLLLG